MNKTDPSTDHLAGPTEPTVETATTSRLPSPPVVGGGTPCPCSYHSTTPLIPLEPTVGGVGQA